MPIVDCCKLVGNLDLAIDDCIISINSSCSTELIPCGNNVLPGPTTGTVSITGYASESIFKGCPGRAGVNLPWIRKYDCENDEMYFISQGEGQSFIVGETDGLVSLKNSLDVTCVSYSASSSSGPATIYMEETQTNGYGLIYRGEPFPFQTDDDGVIFTNLGNLGIPKLYLQNFNVTFNPGELPIATYSFVHHIKV